MNPFEEAFRCDGVSDGVAVVLGDYFFALANVEDCPSVGLGQRAPGTIDMTPGVDTMRPASLASHASSINTPPFSVARVEPDEFS
jgi:hypothetical protein